MLARSSLLESLLSLPEPQRLTAIQSLSPPEAEALLYDWEGFWARPNQLEPPGDWRQWFLCGGRGLGKTRTGAEWIRKQLVELPGCRVAIVARTIADARDTCVEGESGLLSCFPPAERRRIEDKWNRSQGSGELPNGSSWQCFSSEKPAALRGPQFHIMWADELAAWEKQRAAWEQVPFIVRLPFPAAPSRAGRVVITSTPRPVKEIRDLLADPLTVVTRGKTSENWHNLNALTKAKLDKLKGTRLGRQELDAELLDDTPGALWARALIESLRASCPMVRYEDRPAEVDLVRIVVGVDPAVTSADESDETGIVVVGKASNGHLYVLEDASCRDKPERWAARAISALEKWKADRIVAEVNNGGDLVESVIHAVDPNAPVKKVHASRGKMTRAEPIATRYERKEAHHCGTFEKLEDQMCTYVPGEKSPDRMDALVWAATELSGARVVVV